jgi:2-polyprenyl-6-methoxyphenol hydroxylase-like FAD-dependent oxidoreductase
MRAARANESHVLVVGAGIAGLAAARALDRIGCAVDVVERERTLVDAGTGVYLPGNATRALRALGLEPHVVERAAVVPRQRFSDHRGRLLVEVDVVELWSGIGPCVALPRADLHAVLLEGARNASIRRGVTLLGLSGHGGTVSVGFDDGTAGDYDLVIGADGIRSTTRRLAFGSDVHARQVGQRGWRFVTACPAETTTWSVMLDRRCAFLTIPVGHGRVYCYGDVLGKSGEEGEADLAHCFAGFAEPVPTLLDSVARDTFVHRSTIEEVALDSWAQGRVLLVGDAAHATSPNMAQGAAMALEDAIVLAECLDRLDSIPAALSAYEARRRPRTEWVRRQTHRRDRTRYVATPIRNTLLRTFGRAIFHANYRPLLAEP